MAVSTINPYSSGAVVFNQQPYMAFYERQAAKKQAKEDALDNYFRDLGKNVTSAGMRSQDVPVLLQKNKDWQDFYAQNKAAIVNPKLDNGKSYSEYMNRYQDQMGTVAQSKEALKSMDEIGKMKLNPQMSYVFDDPHFMEQVQKHDLPINDPHREGINLASISLPPKPVDTKEWDAYNKYLTGGIPYDKVPGQTQNLPGFKTRTPIIQQYSPENQMVIGQHAANAYDTDKRWRSEANKYFNELQHNPEEYKRANELYKLRYGNDIDDPKEAWIAKGILDNNMKATEYKEGKDELGMAQFMENLRHMHAKELIKYKKDIDPNNTEMNNVWTKTYLDDVMQTAKNSGERHHVYNPSNGQSYYYYNMVKPDPFLLKSFAIGDRYPERLGVTEAGEMFPVFYKYDKDGKVITLKDGKTPALDNDLSQPMSYEQALVNVGFRGRTKKQIGEDFKGGIPGTTAPKVSSTDWKSRAKKVQ